MFSVAIIGPDGAGKSTICKRIEKDFDVPIKYLYMGVSLDSSNTMLPTTRLVHFIKKLAGAQPDTHGPRPLSSSPSKPRGFPRRILSGAKGILRLAYWLSEEWYRQFIAWYHQLRGRIVLFDRHFYFDYYHYDIAKTAKNRSFAKRIHGFMLQNIYPKPDLVIFLDAPGEVLYARKREGTVDLLEHRRQEFKEFQGLVKNFVVIDVTQSQEIVLNEVKERIWNFYLENVKEKKQVLLAGHHVKK